MPDTDEEDVIEIPIEDSDDEPSDESKECLVTLINNFST
jgi:hypothetical protein